MLDAAAMCDCTQNSNKNTGSDNGYNNAAYETDRRARDQQVHEQAPDERADKPYDDIANNTITTTAHNLTRQKTGDKTDNQPDDQTTHAECKTENHRCYTSISKSFSIGSSFCYTFCGPL